jgi:hypothetical protein
VKVTPMRPPFQTATRSIRKRLALLWIWELRRRVPFSWRQDHFGAFSIFDSLNGFQTKSQNPKTSHPVPFLSGTSNCANCCEAS